MDARTEISGTGRSVWAAWTLLTIGVVVASVSAILIRYAQEAPPLAISFWRCALGAAVLAPFSRLRPGAIPPRSLRVCVLSGVFLALHFATWITSLELTTVAASVLLVCTTPIWVGLAAWLVLGERLSSAGWVGIFLTVVGAALIGGGDLSGSNITGDVLALIGGIMGGWYVLAGQVARRDVGTLQYVVIAYAVSAVLLLIACLVSGTELSGYRGDTWLAIGGLVVGPQILGHTLINLVLKDIEATMVSVTIMAEPLIATWLAYLLFDEIPTALVYPGGAAILIGIYVMSVTRRSPPVLVE